VVGSVDILLGYFAIYNISTLRQGLLEKRKAQSAGTEILQDYLHLNLTHNAQELFNEIQVRVVQ